MLRASLAAMTATTPWSSATREAYAMLIRPVCKRQFVVLPNALLNDDRLSIETRGMLAHLLSKPRNWAPRPRPLARAMSRSGAKLGSTKLRRMMKEAKDAGYMTRSRKQRHKKNGDFGPYEYVVGMPADVAAYIARTSELENESSSDEV